jgi:hypothetical protein
MSNGLSTMVGPLLEAKPKHCLPTSVLPAAAPAPISCYPVLLPLLLHLSLLLPLPLLSLLLLK